MSLCLTLAAKEAWANTPPKKPSQSQLAELLETNKQTLSMTENGQRKAPIKKLIKLHNIFGVTANELLPKDWQSFDKSQIKQTSSFYGTFLPIVG